MVGAGHVLLASLHPNADAAQSVESFSARRAQQMKTDPLAWFESSECARSTVRHVADCITPAFAIFQASPAAVPFRILHFCCFELPLHWAARVSLFSHAQH